MPKFQLAILFLKNVKSRSEQNQKNNQSQHYGKIHVVFHKIDFRKQSPSIAMD